jgi:hypothetical protein
LQNGVSFFLAIIGLAGIGLLMTYTSRAGLATGPRRNDFRVQVVDVTIPEGAATISTSSFTEVDPERTIVLLSGVLQSAIGYEAEVDQAPDRTFAAVRLEEEGSILSAQRAIAADTSTFMKVLLIEYIGPAGGPNEILVRDRYELTMADGVFTAASGVISTVNDLTDAVVFSSGSFVDQSDSILYQGGDAIAYLDESGAVQLERGSSEANAVFTGQVVEFTGDQWTVQQGLSVPGDYPEGSEVAIDSVGTVSNAWTYFTWKTENPFLDERGHWVYLEDPETLVVTEHPNADGEKAVYWSVIQNPQLYVQQSQAFEDFGGLYDVIIGGFSPLRSVKRGFAWVTGFTTGAGSAHPKEIWSVELASTSSINLERYRGANALSYHAQVVSLPTRLYRDVDTITPVLRELYLEEGICVEDQQEVMIHAWADQVDSILISNRRWFVGSKWQAFSGREDIAWTIPKRHGDHIIYVRFRSPTENQSITQRIFVRQTDTCPETVTCRTAACTLQAVDDLPPLE